jgi:hypothetical protein
LSCVEIKTGRECRENIHVSNIVKNERDGGKGEKLLENNGRGKRDIK